MHTQLLTLLTWLHLAIFMPFIYGKQQELGMKRPNLSELASTAEVDNSPCDMFFLPDDEGSQEALRTWEASANTTQVINIVFS